jgi:hypothetical protein
MGKRHVSLAVWAKAGMHLPPPPKPASWLDSHRRRSPSPGWALPHVSLPDSAQAAEPTRVAKVSLPALGVAAGAYRLWLRRQVTRVACPDMPPLRDGLF